MKLELTFLRSKVAQRIFFLFVACALIPITILAVISQITVTKQLRKQSQERLRQTSGSMAQFIYQRFYHLDDNLKMIAANLIASPEQLSYYIPQEPKSGLKPRFSGLALVAEDGTSRHLFGHISNLPEISPEAKEIILNGKTTVITDLQENEQTRIFMGVATHPARQTKDLLFAEVNPSFIWSTLKDDFLLYGSQMCLMDQSNNILQTTMRLPISFPNSALLQMEENQPSHFEWTHMGKNYIAGFRPIVLGNIFLSDNWKLVLNEPKVVVLKPAGETWNSFPYIILAVLWFVLFLSIIQIRRSMVPLEKLKEGTKRLAKREFDSRVTVTSKDEFAEVAESFNSMASQLGKQFKALIVMGEIDRDILSVLDTEKIVNTVVTRIRDVFPCKSMSITVIDSDSVDTAQTYIGEDQSEKREIKEKVKITLEDMQTLKENPETLMITLDDNLPHYLEPLANRGLKSFLVLPLFLKEELAGIIALGYVKPPRFSQEDLDNARRLANQVAVAFSNTRLIEELSELNWGTLHALARAIDAKSSWTAGHSERSTKLAIKIGKVMRLAKEELDDLRRAGLLHDIGKLGIPAEILDKAGNLTPEEQDLMRKHTSLGARILEPIAAYSNVIPIVLQHHEFYDGTGYPNGLIGESINPGARIFIVADTYDALISDRPYRKALDHKSAIKYIKEGAGIKFDPKVVDAFLKVMAKESKK
jgi:putative nucleotidyltransferase with HDIG domain